MQITGKGDEPPAAERHEQLWRATSYWDKTRRNGIRLDFKQYVTRQNYSRFVRADLAKQFRQVMCFSLRTIILHRFKGGCRTDVRDYFENTTPWNWVLFLFTTELNNFVKDYNSSRVGVICRVSVPNFKDRIIFQTLWIRGLQFVSTTELKILSRTIILQGWVSSVISNFKYGIISKCFELEG